MTFRPTQNRVHFERIVRKFTAKEVIVDYQPQLECRVVAVGPQCEHVKKGMKVLVALNVGTPIEGIDGRICREIDILAIVP